MEPEIEKILAGLRRALAAAKDDVARIEAAIAVLVEPTMPASTERTYRRSDLRRKCTAAHRRQVALAVVGEMPGAFRTEIVAEVRRRCPGHAYSSVEHDLNTHAALGVIERWVDPDARGRVRLRLIETPRHETEAEPVHGAGVRMF